MKTKYDWSGVPEHIKIITTDDNGSVTGFSNPFTYNGKWCCSFTLVNVSPFKGNWQDSLEERPNEND